MTTDTALTGKIAVVTGAASGIGHAIAVDLAQAGATLALVDLDRDGAEKTAKEIGGEATVFATDLTDPESITAMISGVSEKFGLPDIIVNAAGYDRVEPFLQNDDELWTRLVAINYLGAVRLCHAFLTKIVEAERTTKIINISSDAGRVGSSGETVYAGTKGALIAFSKSLAREMARYKINVNVVCPGPTDTPLFGTLPEKLQDGLKRAIPFRRVGTPEEVASAVRFFASNDSDFVTGQVLSVSGGLTMAG